MCFGSGSKAQISQNALQSGTAPIVPMWAYLHDTKKHAEFEAATVDEVHYHFMKWRGQLCLRKWGNWQQQYTWVVYLE